MSRRFPSCFSTLGHRCSTGSLFSTTGAVRWQSSSPARKTDIRAALATLGLNTMENDNNKSLKTAYIDLVKVHHPDREGGSEEKMKNISIAYDMLRTLTASERVSFKAPSKPTTVAKPNTMWRGSSEATGGPMRDIRVDAVTEALHISIRKGDTLRVGQLITGKAVLESRGKGGESVMHVAAKAGHPDIIRLLVSEGAVVDFSGRYGYTPLHTAVEAGQHQAVRMLLKYYAAVNATTDAWQCTPLHISAVTGDAKCAKILIKHGADLEATSSGLTPLRVAVNHGHAELVDLLIKCQEANGDVAKVYGYCQDADLEDSEPLPIGDKYDMPEVEF